MLSSLLSLGQDACVNSSETGLHRVKALARKVREALASIDQETSRYAAATGLSCPPGCGHCCLSPDVETSVLEMIPLALELIENGTDQLWLEKTAEGSSQCVFFESHGGDKGRCGNYGNRPSLCRLFGFAARRDRYGVLEHIACKVQKAARVEALAACRDALRSGFEPPEYGAVHMVLHDLDPNLASQRFAINEAIRRAIEFVAMEKYYHDLIARESELALEPSAPNQLEAVAGDILHNAVGP